MDKKIYGEKNNFGQTFFAGEKFLVNIKRRKKSGRKKIIVKKILVKKISSEKMFGEKISSGLVWSGLFWSGVRRLLHG